MGCSMILEYTDIISFSLTMVADGFQGIFEDFCKTTFYLHLMLNIFGSNFFLRLKHMLKHSSIVFICKDSKCSGDLNIPSAVS